MSQPSTHRHTCRLCCISVTRLVPGVAGAGRGPGCRAASAPPAPSPSPPPSTAPHPAPPAASSAPPRRRPDRGRRVAGTVRRRCAMPHAPARAPTPPAPSTGSARHQLSRLAAARGGIEPPRALHSSSVAERKSLRRQGARGRTWRSHSTTSSVLQCPTTAGSDAARPAHTCGVGRGPVCGGWSPPLSRAWAMIRKDTRSGSNRAPASRSRQVSCPSGHWQRS